MQRTLTLSIALLLGVFLCMVFAQELKVKSFQVAEGDIIARTSPREDLNGKPCAVIRVGIGLTNVDFAGNLMGEPIYNPGEYLVYMPQGNTELTVRHKDFVPLTVRFSDYGIHRLESGCTYQLVILYAGTPPPPTETLEGNYLLLNITPSHARVSIDGKAAGVANSEGIFKSFLTPGFHTYKVEAEGYDAQSGRVQMSNDRIDLSIRLRSILASLRVQCATSGASIYVDDEYKGVTRWEGKLTPRTYLVEARKSGYRSVRQTVNLSDQQVLNLPLPELQPIYGSLRLDYEPDNAEVYMDGQLLGRTPNIFRNLLVGTHTLKISKEGYATHTEKVTISENQQASVSGKLERTGGAVSLSSNSSGGTGSINGHDYVDLGLSVKWATQNFGASSPSDYGDYFAWGETRPKSSYTWSNCFDCLDSEGKSWGTYKVGGQTRIIPTSGHDTARENWGGSWRLPTDAEFDELCQKCKWTWTTQGGHKGYLVTSKTNGNSIFLPAAGWCNGPFTYDKGEYGGYWSSTLSSSSSFVARRLNFYSSYHSTSSYFRSVGQSVRPVTD